MTKHGKPAMRSQQGFLLFEFLLVSVLVVSLLASVALILNQQRERDYVRIRATWVSQYMMATGSYMAQQGAVTPAVLVRNGTDWLKDNTCGGAFTPANAHLSCEVPTDFNNDFGLGPPTVTFDWSNPATPLANVAFGVVDGPGGVPSPVRAAELMTATNSKLESVGFNFAEVFNVNTNDPAFDPVINPAAFVARLQSGNLDGVIDAQIPSGIFVRLDGNSVMTGPLINANNNWAMIGRDASGVENAVAQSPTASVNVNDVFVRSAEGGAGAWTSETHELAREAFELAARAPNFITNVRSGSTMFKPTCPLGLTPELYATPAGFIGGDGPPNVPGGSAFVSGVRIDVNDLGAQWSLVMEVLFDGSTGFEPIPAANPEMGLISATVICED